MSANNEFRGSECADTIPEAKALGDKWIKEHKQGCRLCKIEKHRRR